ncbi:hypothetical protein [Ardenticatena maritima]|uniref:Uncharacterized protein n=2 Tax=Ardenticatena maritima TaxID=872965 RepID=A0A0P6YS79_9CHLR|nr:hypothetical protein [Ardenticatena maritima]KPL87974.1 hypothetical protein SE16_10675 [Ardenticatena maritima]
MNEANELAQLLNIVCSATVEAIRDDDTARREALAEQLDTLRADIRDESPTVAHFFGVLAAWLRGTLPDDATIRALPTPFARALRQMLRETGAPAPAPEAPISQQTLAQLVAAVVAAAKHKDPEPARKLAATIINIETQLPDSARADALPFFENLRALLGGADARTLPPPAAEPYASVWQTVLYLVSVGEDMNTVARQALLDRLIHNTQFVRRSGDETLAQQLATALLDVQRSAAEQNASDIATLVAAVRALLLGYDPTPYAEALQGDVRDAWERILAENA